MKTKFSFLNTILIIFILLTIIIIIYQYNHPEVKVIANEPKQENNLISMLIEQADGTYKESKENVWNNDKYIFNSELSGCEQGSKLSYDGKNIQVDASKSDKCYVYFDIATLAKKCRFNPDEKLSCTLLSEYNQDGDNQIYYHDGKGTYTNSNLEAGDYSYRYSGSSEAVKNYVCLDGISTENECSSDADLYRIIGLFPNDIGEYEMKLIKYDYATKDELGDDSTAPGGAYYGKYPHGKGYYLGNNYDNIISYYWNSTKGKIVDTNSNTSMWQYSNLNKVNLNNFYLNYITSKVENLDVHIDKHTWITGGLRYWINNNSINIQQIFNNEVGNEKISINNVNCYSETDNQTAVQCQETDITSSVKIGLMYVSDYGYASSANIWSNKMEYSTRMNPDGYNSELIKNNNWMYMGLFEWTISRSASKGVDAWRVFAEACVGGAGELSGFAIRPTFFLTSDTKWASGDGTHDNPYRLDLN